MDCLYCDGKLEFVNSDYVLSNKILEVYYVCDTCNTIFKNQTTLSSYENLFYRGA